MGEFAELAIQVMARCETLGTLSQNPSCLDRRYLTEQHRLANQLASGWMIEAGMTTWQDAVGNIWGRYTSSVPNAPRLILGSHLDTVPNGGKYDGMLGVVAAISLVAMFDGEPDAVLLVIAFNTCTQALLFHFWHDLAEGRIHRVLHPVANILGLGR